MTATNVAGRDEEPPNDLEAEVAVLGSMLLDPEAADRVETILRPEHFFRRSHADVFAVMTEMRAGVRVIDIVLLREDLQRRGILETVGGTSFLSRIVAAVPTAANAVHYAKIVRRRARSRAALAGADAVIRSVKDADDESRTAAAIEGLRLLYAQDDVGAATSRWDLAASLEEPDPPPPDEFVARVFVRPGVHVGFGPPQSGKSWGFMAMCFDAVMGGGNFLGSEDLWIKSLREPRDGRREICLWVYGSEDTRDRVRRRLRTLHRSGPHSDKQIPRSAFYFATPPGGTPVSSPAGKRWLEEQIRATDASIVVLDTVTSLCAGGLDVNKAEEVAPFMAWCHGLRDRHQLLVFLLHHTRKGPADARKATPSKADSMLGAGTWRSQSDGALLLDANDGKTQDVLVVSVKAKDVDRPIPAFHATLDPATARFRPLTDDETPPEPEPLHRGGRPAKCSVEAVLALRPGHPEGVHWKAMSELLDVASGTWNNNKRAIQDELLRLDHVVVAGVLRWAKDGEVVS